MPADLIRRINLDHLYPPFVSKALELLAACRARGADYFAISGYRSPQEQAALYFRGRTTPGDIVTDAKPYYSSHNYGLAIDFALDADTQRAGLQPDWKPESYAILGEEAKRLGLVWGGDFSRPDRPHVQWPGYVTGKQLDRLRVVALAKKDSSDLARLRRVWLSMK